MLTRLFSGLSQAKKPLKVAITGAAGQIGYSVLFRIANGAMLGANQPVVLSLIDVPQAAKVLQGVRMELIDSAFPLVKDIICTDSAKTGLTDADVVLFIGARPRGPGMERADLLKVNAQIFIDQGKILDEVASKDCKILVVGNPANTNCLIGSHFAKRVPKENWTAMSRLDHDRALGQLRLKTGCQLADIEKFCVWGNHSPTMFPDLTYCTIKGKPAIPQVGEEWYKKTFTPCVQKRGAQVIAARGLSSAGSAGNAAISHVHTWFHGTQGDHWSSFCVQSNGEYGVPKGLIFSYPVKVSNCKYEIVKDLPLNEYQKEKLKVTIDELVSERNAVESMLK